MNSSKKGDELEDAFFDFLVEQQRREELVYGLYPSNRCKIFKKKSYPCKERGAEVQFDIVIELYREGRTEASSYVVFECKNYRGGIPETCVTDFSDKLGRVFKHAHKGVLVVSSRLQSGADSLARSRSLGIVKYDQTGLDVVADRSGRNYLEARFVRSQIFQDERITKSLRFSAFNEGRFFGAINQFLRSIEPDLFTADEKEDRNPRGSVSYVSAGDIDMRANEVLRSVGYKSGPVDLKGICSSLSIDLQFSDELRLDPDGTTILGSANFDKRSIQINAHRDPNRERFTLGHEIGHFCLNHDRYLRSEMIVEQDLFADIEARDVFNYERLEFQANAFASSILLPGDVFRVAVDVGRSRFDIQDRGHGYIYVDDQPCNFAPYDDLLSDLSQYFEVSKQAIEIKLKKSGLLNDRRRGRESLPTARLLGALASLKW
ncbi:ImmA/IrrE family metallo-endopeptidase [Rhizobium leguminosarum]|uniref:ImmA/IrrE family metallo-endopeptidase n=1 Tax=Rhizobium leguminosarum TaxID=384 RepID=UPI00103FA346|nr:ImmA/IrrE family metallo-endopeptidase [Rhizobium leguminosarum]TBY80626.1 ImmA/IrrE family metallo-endopeptidase [Rhizobium leguminosarum bv. viciae]TBZ14668.1 ImmA/IrrE family metallo-endopeptidase [Rhizobium leguminosarum bv. viciae]